MERAVLMAQGKRVGVGDLGLRPVSDNGGGSIEDLNLEEVERLLIQKALARYNGSYGQNWYPERVMNAWRDRWYSGMLEEPPLQ